MSDATDEYGGISAATAHAVTLGRDQCVSSPTAMRPCLCFETRVIDGADIVRSFHIEREISSCPGVALVVWRCFHSLSRLQVG